MFKKALQVYETALTSILLILLISPLWAPMALLLYITVKGTK